MEIIIKSELNHREVTSIEYLEVFFFEEQGYTKEELSSWIKAKNVFFVLAKDLEKVLGYLIFQEHDSFLEIFKIAVRSECQKRHIGSQMIHKLRETKQDRVLAEVKSNSELVNFYLKNKFQIYGTKKNYYGNGIDAFLIELKLN